jgi:hypothetical protein
MELKGHLINERIYFTGKLLQRSAGNNYFFLKSKEFQENLNELFLAIKDKHFDKGDLNYDDAIIFKSAIDFIISSLDYLDTSTTSLYPYEIVECLELALKDYVVDNNIYIITTNLLNSNDDYYIQTNTLEDKIIRDIHLNYGVSINSRLIRIAFPKSRIRDYFALSVLYHELGHFVDNKFQVSELIYNKINSSRSKKLREILNNNVRFFQNHIREYVADLFASQYVGTSFFNQIEYLSFSEWDYDSDVQTHPSFLKRKKVVSDFLGRKKNPFVSLICSGFLQATGYDLEIRHRLVDLNSRDPFPLSNMDDMGIHGLFPSLSKLLIGTPMTDIYSSQDKLKKFDILNNIVEKTIQNHLILTSWNVQKH